MSTEIAALLDQAPGCLSLDSDELKELILGWRRNDRTVHWMVAQIKVFCPSVTDRMVDARIRKWGGARKNKYDNSKRSQGQKRKSVANSQPVIEINMSPSPSSALSTEDPKVTEILSGISNWYDSIFEEDPKGHLLSLDYKPSATFLEAIYQSRSAFFIADLCGTLYDLDLSTALLSVDECHLNIGIWNPFELIYGFATIVEYRTYYPSTFSATEPELFDSYEDFFVDQHPVVALLKLQVPPHLLPRLINQFVSLTETKLRHQIQQLADLFELATRPTWKAFLIQRARILLTQKRFQEAEAVLRESVLEKYKNYGPCISLARTLSGLAEIERNGPRFVLAVDDLLLQWVFTGHVKSYIARLCHGVCSALLDQRSDTQYALKFCAFCYYDVGTVLRFLGHCRRLSSILCEHRRAEDAAIYIDGFVLGVLEYIDEYFDLPRRKLSEPEVDIANESTSHTERPET